MEGMFKNYKVVIKLSNEKAITVVVRASNNAGAIVKGIDEIDISEREIVENISVVCIDY